MDSVCAFLPPMPDYGFESWLGLEFTDFTMCVLKLGVGFLFFFCFFLFFSPGTPVSSSPSSVNGFSL